MEIIQEKNIKKNDDIDSTIIDQIKSIISEDEIRILLKQIRNNPKINENFVDLLDKIKNYDSLTSL